MKRLLCFIGIHHWCVVKEGMGRYSDTGRDCYVVFRKCKRCHKVVRKVA